MEKYLLMIIYLFLFGLFIALCPLIGALYGYALSFFFDDMFKKIFEILGFGDLELWQFGALLGFIYPLLGSGNVTKK
jgi:hypothetical protein